jgi:hypothetical protein
MARGDDRSVCVGRNRTISSEIEADEIIRNIKRGGVKITVLEIGSGRTPGEALVR